MAKETILFISTKEERASAGKVRIKYFKQALEANGYTLQNFELDLSGLKKYLKYLFRSPPKKVVEISKKADLVMTTVPTILNAIISHKVAKKHKLPLIVDIRDLWEEYAKSAHQITYHLGIVKKLVKEYYQALHYASKIFVVTEPMKQHYENVLKTKEKVIFISNGTDTDIIKCDENIKREEDLVYLADLDWPYHNLEFLFEALKNNGLRLMVIGGGRYLPTMKEKAQNLRINDRVFFTGWIPYENLTNHLCRAKVGVVGRPFIDNIEYLYAIPVKTYDYLAAGLPVAGYGPPNSILEDFIRKNAVGTYVSQPDPKILLKELKNLVEEHASYIKRARELAVNFDRKKLAQKMVDIVKSTLA